MNSVHSKLKTARLLAGMNISEVAQATGISHAQIGRLERGERRLYVHDLLKIARAIGCKPSELIDDEDQGARAA